VESKWSSKFELKPGRWVFVPSTVSKLEGAYIKKTIQSKWNPPAFYYHLRAGGHVAALRSHLNSRYYLHVDISDFFGSINRTRLTRVLKPILGYHLARDWAHKSTVKLRTGQSNIILPYGFVQSPILASLCLYESALGKFLDEIYKEKGVLVSVYVDDIIVSTESLERCREINSLIYLAAKRSRLDFNLTKSQVPAEEIIAFNVKLNRAGTELTQDRYLKFANELVSSDSDAQRKGILDYVCAINETQYVALGSETLVH
jgi:hypothetical protein